MTEFLKIRLDPRPSKITRPLLDQFLKDRERKEISEYIREADERGDVTITMIPPPEEEPE